MSLHHFPIRNSLNSINFLRSFLEPPLPIVQTRHLLLLALSTRTTSSYCSPFQFITSSHFTHPGKLWFNTTIVVIMVESGTAQLISATTLNSVCLTGIKPNKGALRQEKTLQVRVWIFNSCWVWWCPPQLSPTEEGHLPTKLVKNQATIYVEN